MPGSSSPGSASRSTTDVLIAGGGPCGLMLANELGRRGIRCLLIDAKPGTLCRQAQGLPSVDVRFGWTLERFDDDGREVSATVRPTRDGPAQEVRARFLVGADRCSTVFIAGGRCWRSGWTCRPPRRSRRARGNSGWTCGSCLCRRLRCANL